MSTLYRKVYLGYGLGPLLTSFLAPLVLAILLVALWFGAAGAEIKKGTALARNVQESANFTVDPFYLFSLGLISLLAIVMIAVEARRSPFSLHLAHWIFVYVFFCAAPLVQYRLGFFPWRGLTSFDLNTLLAANLAVLTWCVTWIISRYVQRAALFRWLPPLGPRVTTLGLWISLFLAAATTFYFLVALGPEALVTRAAYKTSLNDAIGASSVRLIVDKVFRVFPVAAVAGSIWYLRKGQIAMWKRLMIVVVATGFLLISDFPLGAARYWSGAVYLGLLLTVFGRRLRTGWPLVFLLVGGLLIVFPVLSTVRAADSLQEVISSVSNPNFLGPNLGRGDYDAYAMIGYTIEYVSNGPGIAYGYQLLGALLFFVPRILWPDKPLGSGYTVAVDQDLVWNNVSSPAIAEGFINFGWIGIILFAVVLSWIFGALDASYEQAERRGHDTILRLIYPFCIVLVFFVMRGDLLSSTAYITGFTVAFLALSVRLPKFKARSDT